MAESMTVRQAESVRLTIDSARIVNRLQDHLHGKTRDGEPLELSATQIAAAKILLDRTLPILSSADITAHSSPESVSEEQLKASLIALIRSDPRIIKELAPYLGAYALPAPSVEVGNTTQHAPQQPVDKP